MLKTSRSRIYYKPVPVSEVDIEIMNYIDTEHREHPFKGVERMVLDLWRDGYAVGSKRVRRLMREMGIHTFYTKKKLNNLGAMSFIRPYLLRHQEITHCNQVWSIDITYVRMAKGFMYLTAIIDTYSRYVVAYRLSNTLDSNNVVDVLQEAVAKHGAPEIINSDQGSQFTSWKWVDAVARLGIQISMDGRGRCLDNHWIERFWRTLKTEFVYLWPAESGNELKNGIDNYIEYYNDKRYHSDINNYTPEQYYDYAV